MYILSPRNAIYGYSAYCKSILAKNIANIALDYG